MQAFAICVHMVILIYNSKGRLYGHVTGWLVDPVFYPIARDDPSQNKETGPVSGRTRSPDFLL